MAQWVNHLPDSLSPGPQNTGNIWSQQPKNLIHGEGSVHPYGEMRQEDKRISRRFQKARLTR